MKRYKIHISWRGFVNGARLRPSADPNVETKFVEHPDGEWVRYEDAKTRIVEQAAALDAGANLWNRSLLRIEELEATLEPYAKCYEKIKDKPLAAGDIVP